MPLAPGSRLGPYEIVSPLGAGGMGEVWRARDDRVGREVAIKVVRERFSDRFEREARAVAALNHPNLCTLYDVGPEYLVMELIEGETLRSRLTAGAIPLRHALDWARQLAQGLAAAHAQGIVHRDLKPENIMLTASRRLKILDFGLAKAAAVAASGDAETLGATALTAATSAGAVLGTAGYMAPEQVRGEAATPASDIFAFGAILYEMLSGRRAFQAPTAVELMTAILREEPVEITLPSAVGGAPAPLPLTLDRIVRRCLEKAPAERFQSAADLDFALSALADASSTTLAGATAAAARRRRRRFPALGGYIVAVAATAAVSAVFMLDRQPSAIPATAIRPLVLDSPLQGAVWSPTGDALALASPDGPNAPSQLFLERLGAAPELLTRSQGGLPAAGAGGDQDGVVPLGWSADGRSIIYASNEVTAPTVWSVAAVGGAPRLLDDLGHPSGGAYAMAWHGDALAALIEQPDGTLGVGYSQPAGTPLRWYRPDPFAVRAIGDYVTLAFSPDGRQLLLSVPDAAGPVRTWLLPFPPDPAHPPHQILANLPPHAYSPKFSWTPDGRHLLLATYNGAASSLWEADPTTSRMRKLAATPNLYWAALAPHHDVLAMLRISRDLDVVSADTRTGVVSSLVASPHDEDMPAWAEDAPLLIYVTDRDGTPEIWAREPARADRLVVGPVQMGEEGSYQLPVPSPHGRRIAFTLLPVASGSQPTAGRLWIAATAGGSPLPATTPSGDYQVAACWSPDGANLAYLSGAGALFRLMVVPSSGGAAPRVVVPRVGLGVNVDLWSPAWSPDGKLLAYEATDGFVHLVAPDGANDHLLTRTPLAVWTFSADSQSLYGIVTHGSTADLVSVALASGAVHTIGSLGNHLPGAEVQPGYRLSLAPDGRSLAYGTGNDAHELDLVEPYPPATGAMARLREWLHLP